MTEDCDHEAWEESGTWRTCTDCGFGWSDNEARPLTELALAVATIAHTGQVDKIGEPYIGHVVRVSKACRDAGFGDEVTAAALLHDTVEDTDTTLTGLVAVGFPMDVVRAVDALSKRPGEKLTDYYERVRVDRIATAVKWFDVADNADPRRLAKVAPDTRDRLRAKYASAFRLLTAPTP